MTTEKLLANLRHERDVLDNVIKYIERATSTKSHVAKAKDILKSVANDKAEVKGKYTLKGKHWTQTPAGKRKMSKIMKKAWDKRRVKEEIE